MSPLAVVLTIGAVQGVLLVAFVLLLAGNRVRSRRAAVRAGRGEAAVTAAMQDWLLDRAPLAPVTDALRRAPRDTALEQVVLAMTARVPAERQPPLVEALRPQWWVRDLLARGLSWRWTERLRTARMLGALGTPGDEVRVARLLRDPHPAVRAAVVPAIARVGTPSLIGRVLDTLGRQTTVVRYLVGGVLLQSRATLVAQLQARLGRTGASERDLATWIDLAVASREPALLAQAAAMSEHEHLEVRAAATRALGQWFHPEAARRLLARLDDPTPAVRALAARGVGMLGVTDAVPRLTAALADADWWVRFRASLALALLGDAGRAALRATQDSPDRYAADMARLISGLPPGVLRELAES